MKKQIITTADGSKTIYFPDWNESYHSKHGAIQEAKHVYIKSGLDYWLKSNNDKSLRLLEIGFGTGLNAFLSCIYASENSLKLNYHSIEKYPLDAITLNDINYDKLIDSESSLFYDLHQSAWEVETQINTQFYLKKIKTDLLTFDTQDKYDVIYFDAFGPQVQPELWAKPILEKLYNMMSNHSIWVTYSCKGSVRRDLQSIGFEVEKIPGPPGKREMLRAFKF